MTNKKMSNELFESLFDLLTTYNKQVSDMSLQNLERFAKLFSGFTPVNPSTAFSGDFKSLVSSEQMAAFNEMVQENVENFTKLCATSKEITNEMKALMVKIIDFYVQLYPSNETYSLANHVKKLMGSGALLGGDYSNLLKDFITQVTNNIPKAK